MGRLKCDTVPLLTCDSGETQRFLEDSSQEHDDEEINEKTSKRNGINWIVAAAFIVADIAGGGVVTMPKAILTSGYLAGLLITFIVCAIFCYTGILLGQNWLIMCKRWPIYRKEHCRKPYQGIYKK